MQGFGAAAAVAVLVAGLVGSTPLPAMADPAVPTNYESSVLEVVPAHPGVEFDVSGGDAFLGVSVAEGHSAQVPGYFGEPYIRIDTDGSVWVNEDSPALYINEERYGNVSAPPTADGEGEPRWAQVGSEGRFVWHDHRTHWMSPDTPPTAGGDERQVIFPWSIPIVVDGSDATVHGELVWIPPQSAWPPILAGVIALFPLAVSRRRRAAALLVVTGSAATLGILVALAQHMATPSLARGWPVWAVLPVGGLAIAALSTTRRSVGSLRPQELVALAALLVGSWAVSTIEVMWRPVLVSSLPPVVERLAVSLTLWAAVGVVALSVMTTAERRRRPS